MELFIQTNDYDIQRFIINDPSILKKRVDSVIITKEEHEWNDADIKLVQQNTKAMHTLFCTIGPN